MAWIEGPWVTKHDGVYHLQYSGCGTEWDSYAIGVYQSSSPTGPFAYVESSPILRHSGGLIRGTGHHAMARDKSGKLWMLYHVLFGNTDKFDRRLALDPVGFDERGRMFVGGPSERAALAPGVASEPARSNDAGL